MVARHTVIPGVACALVQNGTVLCVRRALSAHFAPGMLTLPGGHVDANETVAQAGVREVYEELGVVINPQDMQFCTVMHRHGSEHDYLVSLFVVTQWQGQLYNREPEKHSELVWISIDTLSQDMIVGHQALLYGWQSQKAYIEHGW